MACFAFRVALWSVAALLVGADSATYGFTNLKQASTCSLGCFSCGCESNLKGLEFNNDVHFNRVSNTIGALATSQITFPEAIFEEEQVNATSSIVIKHIDLTSGDEVETHYDPIMSDKSHDFNIVNLFALANDTFALAYSSRNASLSIEPYCTNRSVYYADSNSVKHEYITVAVYNTTSNQILQNKTIAAGRRIRNRRVFKTANGLASVYKLDDNVSFTLYNEYLHVTGTLTMPVSDPIDDLEACATSGGVFILEKFGTKLTLLQFSHAGVLMQNVTEDVEARDVHMSCSLDSVNLALAWIGGGAIHFTLVQASQLDQRECIFCNLSHGIEADRILDILEVSPTEVALLYEKTTETSTCTDPTESGNTFLPSPFAATFNASSKTNTSELLDVVQALGVHPALGEARFHRSAFVHNKRFVFAYDVFRWSELDVAGFKRFTGYAAYPDLLLNVRAKRLSTDDSDVVRLRDEALCAFKPDLYIPPFRYEGLEAVPRVAMLNGADTVAYSYTEDLLTGVQNYRGTRWQVLDFKQIVNNSIIQYTDVSNTCIATLFNADYEDITKTLTFGVVASIDVRCFGGTFPTFKRLFHLNFTYTGNFLVAVSMSEDASRYALLQLSGASGMSRVLSEDNNLRTASTAPRTQVTFYSFESGNLKSLGTIEANEDSFFDVDMSLSADGNRFAVLQRSTKHGVVFERVGIFSYKGDTWEKTGGDVLGRSFSLSADGRYLAVGDDTVGAVQLVQIHSSGWTAVAKVMGESRDKFGCAVSLSASGDRLAVGASAYGSRSSRGQVQVFSHDQTGWTRLATMTGKPDEFLGLSVSLSKSGDRVAMIGGAAPNLFVRVRGFCEKTKESFVGLVIGLSCIAALTLSLFAVGLCFQHFRRAKYT